MYLKENDVLELRNSCIHVFKQLCTLHRHCIYTLIGGFYNCKTTCVSISSTCICIVYAFSSHRRMLMARALRFFCFQLCAGVCLIFHLLCSSWSLIFCLGIRNSLTDRKAPSHSTVNSTATKQFCFPESPSIACYVFFTRLVHNPFLHDVSPASILLCKCRKSKTKT